MLREAASEVARELRELDTSYGQEERRRQLCHRLLRLVLGAYTPPPELVEALEIAMKLDGLKKPGKLGYGRKESEKYIAAIMAEKRYRKQHGRRASAYAIAREVRELARRSGMTGRSPNSVKEWRRGDPDYQMFAFGPDDAPMTLSPQLS